MVGFFSPLSISQQAGRLNDRLSGLMSHRRLYGAHQGTQTRGHDSERQFLAKVSQTPMGYQRLPSSVPSLPQYIHRTERIRTGVRAYLAPSP